MKKTTQLLSALLLAMGLAASAHAQDAAVEASDAAEPAEQAEATAPVDAAPADAAPTEAAPAAAAPAASSFSPAVQAAIGSPAPGKGLVVFFRPSKFVGAAVGFKVRENEVELGKLRNANYFTLDVEPGAHAYVVHSEAKDVTTIEVEAGETYFLTAAVTMGVMAGRPNLAPSDAAAFEAALPKLKKSKPLD